MSKILENSSKELQNLKDDAKEDVSIGIKESKHNDAKTNITHEDTENQKDKDVKNIYKHENDTNNDTSKAQDEKEKDKPRTPQNQKSTTVWVQFFNSNPNPVPEGAHHVEHIPYDPKTRNAFVRLVFTILFIMLVVTATLLIVVLITPQLSNFFKGVGRIYTFGTSILLIIINVIMVMVGYARVPPWNYLCLVITVLLMTNLTAVVSVRYKTEVLLIAFVATAVTVLICVLLACTSFDFTKWYLFVVAVSCVFCVISLLIGVTMLIMKVHYTPLRLVLLFVGSIINVVMLVIELQMVLGGKSVELSETDYALAAYLLYTSIVHLFLKMVGITGIAHD